MTVLSLLGALKAVILTAFNASSNDKIVVWLRTVARTAFNDYSNDDKTFTWQLLLGLLFWWPVMWPSFCNSCEDLALVDFICRCLRADSRLVPSQWEMPLQINAISHWLDANLESALCLIFKWLAVTWLKNSMKRIIVYHSLRDGRLGDMPQVLMLAPIWCHLFEVYDNGVWPESIFVYASVTMVTAYVRNCNGDSGWIIRCAACILIIDVNKLFLSLHAQPGVVHV